MLIYRYFFSRQTIWHAFCLYIGRACKICNRSYVRDGLSDQAVTITDRRIFIEKLANLFNKSRCGTSRAVPVCLKKKTLWSVSDFVVLLLGFASTFYNIR